MDIGTGILVLIVLPVVLSLLVVSTMPQNKARVESFAPEETVSKHLRLEAYQKSLDLGNRLADLGYWSSTDRAGYEIFSRMVATPEAIYYEISLKMLKGGIKIDSLITDALLRELEYTARGHLTTYSHPEYGVWLIAHRPGYEITDASYKPYLDKRKSGIRPPTSCIVVD